MTKQTDTSIESICEELDAEPGPTLADAQAALEAHAKQIRKEAYTQGVKEAARFFREHGDTDVVHALIQKDKTDDIRVGKPTNDGLLKRPEPSPYWEAYLAELKALHRHTEEHLYKRIEELEAKLEKAAEALEWCAKADHSIMARFALAELKGTDR